MILSVLMCMPQFLKHRNHARRPVQATGKGVDISELLGESLFEGFSLIVFQNTLNFL